MRFFAPVFFAIIAACAAIILVIKERPPRATLVLVNGIIHTGDSAGRTASAVAVLGDRIVAVGETKEFRDRFPGAVVLDLEGKTVVPGFIDAHGHMTGLGELLQSVSLVDLRSAEDAVERVKARIATAQPGEWIYGRGWDQNLWEVKEYPTAALLDAVAPANPVVLIRIDGHAIWVNSMAMKLAGVSASTPDTSGGTVVRTKDRTPTGIFIDNARDLVEHVVPPAGRAEIRRAILLAADQCIRNGLTEVGDMGIDSTQIAVYQELASSDSLPLRVYAAIGAPGATWNEWKKRSPLIGYGGMFTLRAVKMYEDGSLGSRGAALVEDYADDPGNRGVTINDRELLPETEAAIAHGYQPCVHAIGDRGNHIVLGTFEQALKGHDPAFIRPRIEHVQVLLPEDIGRFASLGVLPSMQPVHATSDMPWAEARLGPVRVRSAYAWQSLLKTGTIVMSGSDFPNDIMSPLRGFYAAITRMDASGSPENGWYPEEKMTREQALKSYTSWAAYGEFQERWKGTIEPGKVADFTVLSDDIMTIPPAKILTTQVEMTIVRGRVVYDRYADRSSIDQ